MAVLTAAFLAVMVMIGYGMSDTAHDVACSTRPWLDTARGC
jgi:hypothetical protein